MMDIKKSLSTRSGKSLFDSLTEAVHLFPVLSLFAVLLITGCSNPSADGEPTQANAKIVCASDNGGITLPDGFCATLVVEDLSLRSQHSARHIAVASNGDIYIKTRSKKGDIAALRDTTGDFRADVIKFFGDMTEGTGILWATGMAIHNGYLWASNTEAVYRWPMPEGNALVPEGEPEIVVSGFPEQQTHRSKAFTFDESGHLYVIVGAPSNACQEESRTRGSPGMGPPCPLLKKHGGIWRFSANQTGQTFSADARYATGLRNVVGLDWNHTTGALYVMQHGRDQLHSLWPDYFTIEESVKLPAEVMYKVNESDRFSWPYGYYNHMKDTLMLSPEYGGTGEIPISESRFAGEFEEPIIAFPGHWAPNDLLFYTAEQFPERYRGGAFIAFHGSWNRAPRPQKGYYVVFVPFEDGKPSGDYEIFANDFANVEPIPSRGAAEYRPMGLAIGPNGALYISDSKKGRIWRVVYTGKERSTDNTTAAMPADTAEAQPADTVATPSLAGAAHFQKMACQTCHTVDPDEPASTGPPLYDLYGSEVTLQNGQTVTADEAYLRESILNPRAKMVAGYMPVMPSYESQLTEEELGQLVSYIKSL